MIIKRYFSGKFNELGNTRPVKVPFVEEQSLNLADQSGYLTVLHFI